MNHFARIRRFSISLAFSFLASFGAGQHPVAAAGPALRPPAVPLVPCDPYFSIWSPADRLADADTVHWTGRPHPLTGLVRIDGKPFRMIGTVPAAVPALPQLGVEVLPTRTIARFEGAGAAITLTFLTALLPEDLAILSRPVTYLGWECRSIDGKPHDVELALAASGELTVDSPAQVVLGASETAGDLAVVKLGSEEQAVLARRGDDLRIDWGYLYLAAPAGAVAARAFGEREALANAFCTGGAKSVAGAPPQAAVRADRITGCLTLAPVSAGESPITGWLLLAYDDLFSIQYMKKNLRPYWRRTGWEAPDLLKAAAADFPALRERCQAFDAELMADLTRAGGEKYARLAAEIGRASCRERV